MLGEQKAANTLGLGSAWGAQETLRELICLERRVDGYQTEKQLRLEGEVFE